MNDLLQDIWQDLREKRLLPVAALMLLGIVAIPVVLTESSAEPTPVATQAPAEQGGAAAVALDTEAAASSAAGSELDVFSSDDPFAPPKEVTRSKDTATAATASDDKAGASGDGAAGGGTAPGGSGGGGSEPLPPAPVPAPETSEYEFVADVTFWNGNRRSTRRLHKLDMLPDQSAPALIFMGVTRDGGDAVFLVDATLSNTGEGSCRPGRQNCVYVAIGAGSEHLFTDPEGRTYRLRVDEIRRVKVKAAAADFAPEAQTATGSPSEARPFSLPSLVDVVVETTAGVAESSKQTTEQAGSSNRTEGR